MCSLKRYGLFGIQHLVEEKVQLMSSPLLYVAMVTSTALKWTPVLCCPTLNFQTESSKSKYYQETGDNIPAATQTFDWNY